MLARVRETEYRERVNQGGARRRSGGGLQKARLDLERARTLFAAESLTKPDLDAAQAAFDAARRKLARARAELELAATALRDSALRRPSPASCSSGGSKRACWSARARSASCSATSAR